jgi:enoyl-CoA hydratase
MPDRPDWVHLAVSEGVAVLTIDHPPVNVLSAPVLGALLDRLGQVARDPGARVVLLESAAEKAFAAGADIREMASMGPPEARVHGARGQAVTLALERLPMPVIAAVHGVCLGGGNEIVLACDFVVASDDARFGQPEIDLGLMPGWGGTQRLPRRIGAARAREWVLTGRPVSAAEAKELGLVLKVVPRAQLATEARALATLLAGKSATGLAAAKAVLRGAIDRELDRGLGEELDRWCELFGTPDQRAGMRAFLEKRPWTPAKRDPVRPS